MNWGIDFSIFRDRLARAYLQKMDQAGVDIILCPAQVTLCLEILPVSKDLFLGALVPGKN